MTLNRVLVGPMAFWQRKEKLDPSKQRPTRQLRQMVELGMSIEFHQLDEEGESSDVGRCRVQEYRESEHQLLVDVPTREGRPLQIGVGGAARLMFELGNVFYKFDSEVVDRFIYTACKFPFPALKMQGPERLESGSRRRAFRVEPLVNSMPIVQWRPIVDDPDSEESPRWLEAALRDISVAGVGLWMSNEIAENLEVDFPLEVSIRLRGAPLPIQMECVVRGLIEVPGEKDRRAVGLEFDLPDEVRQQKISQFVIECEREIAKIRRGI